MSRCQPFVMLFLLMCCHQVAACQSTRAVTPVDVLRAYAAADVTEKGSWQVDPERTRDLAVSHGQVGQEVARRAVWYRPGHPEVSAARIDGQWRLTSGVLASRVAATPAQALALLARAVSSSDAALMRALMPASEREHWSLPRVEAFLRDPQFRPPLLALSQRLAGKPQAQAPAERDGVVTVGDQTGQVVLTKEQDGWKVLDLRPHERFGAVASPPPAAETSD